MHVALLSHSLRSRHPTDDEKSGPFNPFSFDRAWDDSSMGFYKPNKGEFAEGTNENGFLIHLWREMISNGHGSELLPASPALLSKDLSNDDLTADNFGLLKTVDEKMAHPRHCRIGKPLNRGYMAALVIYCGADANWALCKCQRRGDYKTWKWLDTVLSDAIQTLSKHETFSFPLYCGLHAVEIPSDRIGEGFFNSYISTSYDSSVALAFMKSQGTLVEFDSTIGGVSFGKHDMCTLACDVSWVSKYRKEKEILFCRGKGLQWTMQRIGKDKDKVKDITKYRVTLAKERAETLVAMTFSMLSANSHAFSTKELEASVKWWAENMGKRKMTTKEEFVEWVRYHRWLSQSCDVSLLVSALEKSRVHEKVFFD